MRFDDSLSTVLGADTSSAFGALSVFRQLVDLLGRGRVAPRADLIGRLEALRPMVPAAARAACARSLALMTPPAELVTLFAQDEPSVAAAMLRCATLDDEAWAKLLPLAGPTGRAVLRGRADLSPATVRALESFGTTDFALSFDGPAGKATVTAEEEPPAAEPSMPQQGFRIAELVDRIAAFQRERPRPRRAETVPTTFALETDRRGQIVWTDAEPRGPLIGLAPAALAQAARERRGVPGAGIEIGAGPLAGTWHISGEPMYDGDGRFLGLRAAASRTEAPSRGAGLVEGEAIRRLVHELRTPMNAISGFAELMSSEMLGPVSPPHRQAAAAIHGEMSGLLVAIEDLDVAARIDSRTLDLAPGAMPLWPTLEKAAASCPGLHLHGARDAAVLADPRLLERLIVRLLGLLDPGADVTVTFDGRETAIAAQRPDSWAHTASPLAIDANFVADRDGGPLLGTGFTLRLISDLARVLGGRFVAGDRLILSLPARIAPEMRVGGLT